MSPTTSAVSSAHPAITHDGTPGWRDTSGPAAFATTSGVAKVSHASDSNPSSNEAASSSPRVPDSSSLAAAPVKLSSDAELPPPPLVLTAHPSTSSGSTQPATAPRVSPRGGPKPAARSRRSSKYFELSPIPVSMSHHHILNARAFVDKYSYGFTYYLMQSYLYCLLWSCSCLPSLGSSSTLQIDIHCPQASRLGPFPVRARRFGIFHHQKSGRQGSPSRGRHWR